MGSPREAVDEVLEGLRLTPYADCRIAELSWGTRRKVEVARVLLNESAEVLLIDEFASLDAYTQDYLIDRLRGVARDKCIIVATHNPLDVLWADRITVLKEGRVVREYNSFLEVEDELLSVGFKVTITAFNVPDDVESILRGIPGVRSVRVEKLGFLPQPYIPPDTIYVYKTLDGRVIWQGTYAELRRQARYVYVGANPDYEDSTDRIVRRLRDMAARAAPGEAEKYRRLAELVEKGVLCGKKRLIEVEISSPNINPVLQALINAGCAIVGVSCDLLSPLLGAEDR